MEKKSMSLMTDKVWDLAGVGFGPANLSIAVSYENSCRKKATVESDKISMIFLEKDLVLIGIRASSSTMPRCKYRF